ncbi:putative ATP binding protein [Corchorus capsularis]|uniref:Putative ATP binding protein n=1 Tax=Corchorus capsularis TaxID=210143 RepID=A0A1R3HDJ7_COCAP|nr:putative ATP binding protein [Corchorus capsularis]
METTADPSSDITIDGPDSSTVPPNSDHDLLAELESLRESYHLLQSKSSSMEDNLRILQLQRDEAIGQSTVLTGKVHELSLERDFLRHQIEEFEVALKENEEEFARKIEDETRAKFELEKHLEVSRGRIEELESETRVRNEILLAKSLDSIRSVKDNLVKLIENLDDDKEAIDNADDESEELEIKDEELRIFSTEITRVWKLASEANSKVNEYKEARKKEKRELESSVVSLTEENRDINSLLRIALVEKEAVEKSLNKLKGNNEQKRVALLQIAERGLQRVGFGFMMGSGSHEQAIETSGISSSTASTTDSECEEEVVSLASMVEKIMKNLRLEISQLRRSLEESRSDNERLQSLTQKQAQMIEENTLYITELEDRERVLTQNVDELLMEIKETEAEVARWREACELEVEAGKKEVEERDKLVLILKQELEKTKAALEISNGKLKLKEELAATAMAAQAAGERSLQLADSRAAQLRDRVEELTKQLEEAESRERNRRKVRHICWPWRALKMNITNSNNTNNRVQNVKRMLPEMQALLHHTV